MLEIYKVKVFYDRPICFFRFCSQHHGQQRVPPPEPPLDLMCVAANIMPRIILRLLQHLRINSVPSKPQLSAAETLERYGLTVIIQTP